MIDRSTATGRTSVALEPGDDVVCTYKNTFRRPPSGLTLRKVSTGGTGDFDFDIDGEGNAIPNAFARTVEPGLAALVEPADEIADLPTGTYTVKETTPPDIGGTWALDHVDCLPDVAKQDREGDKVSIIVVKGPGTVCTFYNRFTPAGHITLRKITLGGTGDDALPGPAAVRRVAARARADRDHDRGGRSRRGDRRQPGRAADRHVLDPGDDRRPEPLGDRLRRLRRHSRPVRQGAVRARAHERESGTRLHGDQPAHGHRPARAAGAARAAHADGSRRRRSALRAAWPARAPSPRSPSCA